MKPNETLDAQGSILWDRPKLHRFKATYNRVKDAGKVIGHDAESFHFDGHEFVTNYAKYLIEYLEGLFKQKPHAGSEEQP